MRTRFRPVPLQWHFAFSTQQGVVVEDLLDASGKALNPKLEPEEVRRWHVTMVCAMWRGVEGVGLMRQALDALYKIAACTCLLPLPPALAPSADFLTSTVLHQERFAPLTTSSCCSKRGHLQQYLRHSTCRKSPAATSSPAIHPPPTMPPHPTPTLSAR